MKYLLLIGGLLMQPLSAQPFTPNSNVNDILTQPTFQGFAERLLPWDDNSNEPNLQLNQIEQLMPYHSHISPQVVTDTLNKMVIRAEQGERIFYDIYTGAEKRQAPSKQRTGIFVFKGKANAPFAMIAPGGGFAYVGSLHEGFPIAQSIAEQGYNAFVVKYRAGMGGQIATEDMAQAVEFVRKNAKTLQIDPNGYSVWGASAGARMAAYIGSYGTQAFGTTQNSKPNSVIMLYTGHNDYNR
ncbi:alpha/beta hydrolase, partial [Gallibacterium anatis]